MHISPESHASRLGVLKAPVGDLVGQGFVVRIGDIYAAADGSEVFLDRSAGGLQTWEHSWGRIIHPFAVNVAGRLRLDYCLNKHRNVRFWPMADFRGRAVNARFAANDWLAME